MATLFFQGIMAMFSLKIFALLIVGVGVGIIFGAVPGLTSVMAIALFLPVTYGLSPIEGMSILMALYVGSVSGGLISAILLKMPGTPASIATTFDGHPMAEKGQAYKAIGVGIVFSFIGTIISMLALMFIAPVLANFAIKFGPHEYFAVGIFSLTLIAGLAGKSLVKGLITALLGMMVGTIGTAPIDASLRYTFKSMNLRTGFDILVVLVGLYAISEVLSNAGDKDLMENKSITKYTVKAKGLGFTFKEFWSQKWNALISGLLGVGIGILPGIGGATSNIISYSVSKNRSKHPELYGTGIIDGVVASETANNANIGGAMIPLLTLGIPGDAATAMLLGGLIIHGITPGPLLFTQNPDIVYGILAAMFVSSILMVVMEYVGLKGFIKILEVKKYYLLPIIIVLCGVGAYGLNNRTFDIWGILIFGIVGFTMQAFDYPLAPMIMGFVLGPIVELNLRRGMQYSQGNVLEFFTRPISGTFIIIALLSIVLSIARGFITKSKQKSKTKSSN